MTAYNIPRGNRTWQLAEDVVREQVVAGAYRYHTPVRVVACVGDSGRWCFALDDGFTVPLSTLDQCDETIVDWIRELKRSGLYDTAVAAYAAEGGE